MYLAVSLGPLDSLVFAQAKNIMDDFLCAAHPSHECDSGYLTAGGGQRDVLVEAFKELFLRRLCYLNLLN